MEIEERLRYYKSFAKSYFIYLTFEIAIDYEKSHEEAKERVDSGRSTTKKAEKREKQLYTKDTYGKTREE